MLPLTGVLEAVLARLATLPNGHGLDLRTYKRNRGLVVVRETGGAFLVIEQGYAVARHTGVTADALPKLLKTILRREFPRSTQVRIYALAPWDEAAWRAQTRKKI
ncbi:MAG: hypothetical protein AB7E47_04785 [Desulfovibrionaceae bacterium]